MISFLKRHWILLSIALLSIVLRFFQLGTVPPGVTNDEASYVYNAYSIWKTGKDITGKFLPLSINLDYSFSPVPVYLIAPIVGIFGVNPFTGRMVNAILGVGSVIVLYLLVKKLTKHTLLALFSAFVIAVMPWHIHFSRIAYDGLFALFFFLLGMYLFLSFKHRGIIVFAFISFLLGFYSYHGTKLFFVVIIPGLLYLRFNLFKESLRTMILYGIGFSLILLSFLVVMQTQQVNRASVFLWNNTDVLSKTVNDERKQVTVAPFLSELFSNKATVFMRLVFQHYLEAYSPQYLFLYGEVGGLSGIYGTYDRGMVYLFFLPFLVVGLMFTRRVVSLSVACFLFYGLFISGLPSAFVVDKSYAVRSMMMIPFLSVFIAIGFYVCVQKVQTFHRMIVYGVYAIGAIVMIYSISAYAFQYLSRYPVYAAEAWFTSSKDLYQYIEKRKDKKVFIANPGDLLIQFAFHGGFDPEQVRSMYASKESIKTLGDVTFLNGCIDTKGETFSVAKYFDEKSMYITKDECHKEATVSAYIRDRGEPLRVLWKIFE